MIIDFSEPMFYLGVFIAVLFVWDIVANLWKR